MIKDRKFPLRQFVVEESEYVPDGRALSMKVRDSKKHPSLIYIISYELDDSSMDRFELLESENLYLPHSQSIKDFTLKEKQKILSDLLGKGIYITG